MEIIMTYKTKLIALTFLTSVSALALGPEATASPGEELNCQNAVQGKVAWSRSGSSTWGTGNLKDLCEGVDSGAMTRARISCFEGAIAEHNDWKKGIQLCKQSARSESAAPKLSHAQPKKGEVGYTWTDIFGGSTKVLSKVVTNTVQFDIDCHDSSASDAGTKDAISVELFAANGSKVPTKQIRNGRDADGDKDIVLFAREMTAPNCNWVVDAKYVTSEQTGDLNISAAKVSISGSDALWIDEARLIQTTITRRKYEYTDSKGNKLPDSDTDESERVLRHWGRDGGQGYCLSTNPESVNEFRNLAPSCNANATFNVSTGKVSVPKTKASVKNYNVKVKTTDSRGAGTDSNIHLLMHGSKGVVGGNTGVLLNPKISGNAFERGDLDVVNLTSYPDVGTINYITLKSDGRHPGADWVVSYVSVDGKTFNCRDQEIDGAGKITCR